jgi:transposase
MEVFKMSEIRAKYDDEFKKNAVKLSYASPKGVKEVARDLGINENILYRWRKKYTADGEKTRYATLEEENKALRLELAKTKIEADMLKKPQLTCVMTERIYKYFRSLLY